MDKDRYITAGIAIISLVIGSTLTYLYSTQLERYRTALELRNAAWANYFQAQSKIREHRTLHREAKSAETNGNPEKAKTLRKVADSLTTEINLLISRSRFDMAIYGRKNLVEAVVYYYRNYLPARDCKDEDPIEKWCADLAIYKAMREDVLGNDEKVSDRDLIHLIFGCNVTFQDCLSNLNSIN